MRSMNAALKPIIRGQRVAIGNQNSKVIRAFVHWFDEDGDQDIDITATYIGSDTTTIGWNGEHSTEYGCYSGDVRNRRGACAEYVDIIVDEALNHGYKYVVLDARNYTGDKLINVPDCVFGYMEREFAESNPIFVPETLANTIRLQSESSSTIVVIIDLESREYIYLDIDQDGIPVASSNTESILAVIKHYAEMPKFSVYDLLKLHVDTRGMLVDNIDHANLLCKVEDFSKSYVEILKWMGI